jgi:triacylglycerol lipase
MIPHADLARLAADAYLAPAEFEARHPGAGVIHKDGTEAYVIEHVDHVVIAFRGTEITSWRDLLSDVRFKLKATRDFMGARVHTGFAVALSRVWPDIEVLVSKESKPVYLTGHSLGGALAVLCGAMLAVHSVKVAGIVTFGQPRVGNGTLVALMGPIPWHRYVHLADIVARVPLWAMTYRHGGHMTFIGRKRLWRSPSIFTVAWDVFWSGCRLLSDHASANYVDGLKKEAAPRER